MTPEAAGLNDEKLSELTDFIHADPHSDFRSVVIAKDGKIAFEGYFNGHDPESLHDIRSATKSITSMMVGIAIEDGLIADVKEPVFSTLSAYAPFANDGPRKQAITVENLLTMASGLHADDDNSDSPGNEDFLWESDDWVRFSLDLPMADEPGSRWSYASVNTFLLGVLVEEASMESLSSHAKKHLFAPLGITNFDWRSEPSGRTVAQGNLAIRARDMLKLGQLYLDGGRWNGIQVVPETWVQTSIVGRFDVPWDDYDAYGYGWYLHTLNIEGREFQYFFASGNGGNKIYVLPKERMVVAVQSAAYNTNYGQRRSLEVLRKVLAALVASGVRRLTHFTATRFPSPQETRRTTWQVGSNWVIARMGSSASF
ncbi:6-aminohexanoate-dimer hydrolase [Luteimonas padinae]|nr:6-aminohexanoate-dimer hydrolase [Luteimonas padinae]